jgi:uncharacterized membrane protein YeaQ/YmgE (transglycosylase-associated protein family)
MPGSMTSDHLALKTRKDRRGPLALVGGIVGAFIGYMLRPSAFLIGQLPFGAVISRGASLQGLDRILIPTAQTSFNVLVAGLVVGLASGFVAGMFVNRSR